MAEISLSAADITALLSDARDRGGYERYLRKFVESGDLGEDVMEKFQGKERDSALCSSEQIKGARAGRWKALVRGLNLPALLRPFTAL